MSRDAYRYKVMAAMPGTRRQIINRTGLSDMCVHRWVGIIHADGEAHISGWVRSARGPFAAVYTRGPGDDAACELESLTIAETSERYRERMRQAGLWDSAKARSNARRSLRKHVVIKTAWYSALLGPRKKTYQTQQ